MPVKVYVSNPAVPGIDSVTHGVTSGFVPGVTSTPNNDGGESIEGRAKRAKLHGSEHRVLTAFKRSVLHFNPRFIQVCMDAVS